MFLNFFSLVLILSTTFLHCGEKQIDFRNFKSSEHSDQQANLASKSLSPAPPRNQITRKVAVIDYNPIKPGTNETLDDYFAFYSSEYLVQDVINQFKSTSEHVVNFTVAEQFTVNGFPKKVDGYNYTWNAYIDCTNDYSTCHNPDQSQYIRLLNGIDTQGENLCTKIQTGEIDEIWITGSGYMGFGEFVWKIPGDTPDYQPIPFNSALYDARTEDLPDCGRPYFVMFINKGLPPGLHAFGHRIESAMALSDVGLGHWRRCEDNGSEWSRFICTDIDGPLIAGCGDVHYPPNATFDYDYTNKRIVQSNCNDWANYPNLTGTLQNLTDTEWKDYNNQWQTGFDVYSSNGTTLNFESKPTSDIGFKVTSDGFSINYVTGDFNGDGKDDILRYWNDNGLWSSYIFQGANTNSAMIGKIFSNRQGGFWEEQKWFVGDFNGDGKDDMAKFWNHANLWSADVHKSSGSAFSLERWATQQGGYWDEQHWFIGDFNGDGKDDFAKFWNDQGFWTVDIHKSTGTSFIMERWATKQGGYWEDQKWFVGDFNGDGKDDFAKFWNHQGLWSVDVHKSTGSAFVMERWATKQGGYWEEQNWQIGDFNGDGKDDFANYWNDNNAWTVDIHKSSGSGFTMERWATRQGGFWDEQTWQVGDFNGDQKQDFIKFWNDDGYLSADAHLSNGNSFTAYRIATKAKGYSRWRTRQVFWGDFNNDNKLDFLFRRHYSSSLMENSYMRWWFNKIPRKPGAHTSSNGIVYENNWWKYILCYGDDC